MYTCSHVHACCCAICCIIISISCSAPNVVIEPQLPPNTTNPSFSSNSNITDTLISPSSDPPLTDIPTSSTNVIEDPGFSPTAIDNNIEMDDDEAVVVTNSNIN